MLKLLFVSILLMSGIALQASSNISTKVEAQIQKQDPIYRSYIGEFYKNSNGNYEYTGYKISINGQEVVFVAKEEIPNSFIDSLEKGYKMPDSMLYKMYGIGFKKLKRKKNTTQKIQSIFNKKQKFFVQHNGYYYFVLLATK